MFIQTYIRIKKLIGLKYLLKYLYQYEPALFGGPRVRSSGGGQVP